MGKMTNILALLLVTGLPLSSQAAERWYKPEHAEAGMQLYERHCAVCHKPGALGTPDWRTRDANGLLPPPPLNGSAHAWHHPLAVLYKQIMEGSAPGVGSMPPMKGTLSRGEALAVIAYFQSLWSDEIYEAWQQIDASSGKRR
jgi:mono/diheme cytochrome c family protein